MKKTILLAAVSVVALSACQKAADPNSCYGQKNRMVSGLEQAIQVNTQYVTKIESTSWITPKEPLVNWLNSSSEQFKKNIEFINNATAEQLNADCTTDQLAIVEEINTAGVKFIHQQESNIDKINQNKEKILKDLKCTKDCDTLLTTQWLALNKDSQKELGQTLEKLAEKSQVLLAPQKPAADNKTTDTPAPPKTKE